MIDMAWKQTSAWRKGIALVANGDNPRLRH
jgi:hypothetical protein